jgi:MFS family permease
MTGPASDSGHRSAFDEAAFRRYFPASCCATLGSWMARFLLGWGAWDLTGSASWVGLVAAAMLLPTFLLSPIFGIVSDRINPRDGLVTTVALFAVICACAGIACLLDAFSLPWLLCLSAAVGTVTSAHTPIRLALIPLLVSREALPSAIGYSAMTFNASRILGPALAAWMLSVTNTGWTYLAAMALCLAALLFLLRVARPDRKTLWLRDTLKRELGAGLRYARDQAGIRLVFSFTLVNGLLGRTVIELLPALSGQLLGGDSRVLAILTAAAGAGSIAGGLIVSRQAGREERLLRLVMLCLLASAVILLSVRWLDGLAAVGALVLCLSLVTTMVGTCTQALAQLLVAEEYRGRVLSLWTVLAMGAPSLGTLAMGAAAELLGFRAVMSMAAVLGLTALVALYRRRAVLQATN